MDVPPEDPEIRRALYPECTLDHLVPRERLCHRLEFAGPAANEGEIAEGQAPVNVPPGGEEAGHEEHRAGKPLLGLTEDSMTGDTGIPKHGLDCPHDRITVLLIRRRKHGESSRFLGREEVIPCRGLLFVKPRRGFAVDLHRGCPRLEALGGLGNPPEVVHGQGRPDIVDLSQVLEHVSNNGPELRQSYTRSDSHSGDRHHNEERSRTDARPVEQVA